MFFFLNFGDVIAQRCIHFIMTVPMSGCQNYLHFTGKESKTQQV